MKKVERPVLEEDGPPKGADTAGRTTRIAKNGVACKPRFLDLAEAIGEKQLVGDIQMRPQPTFGSKLGIDATRKLAGEGFKRPWPPLITMDEAVRRKIDALFGSKP